MQIRYDLRVLIAAIACALFRVSGAVPSDKHALSFLLRLHISHFASCCQGQLRREIAKTSCVPKTTAPGGQVRSHQQVLDAK